MLQPSVFDRIARRTPDHSLERELYVSDDAFRADLEAIWYREWIFVAHTAELPAEGDYVTFAVGDCQMLLVRGEDDAIRAFHNVCRHRGSLVCTEPSGTVRRRLICPYHQWSYDLNGVLKKARRTTPDFDPGEHGLGTVACEVVAGMVFVCLADNPPDFAPMAEMTTRYLAPFGLGDAAIAFTETTVEEGNWKLVMENNRECYHCRASHPELCVSFPEAPLHSGGGNEDDRLALVSLVDRCEELGLPSGFEVADDNQFRLMRMPFLNDAESMTLTGARAVDRRFADLPDENIGDVLLYHYPSTWNHYMADHAVSVRIVPLGPTTTQLTTTWLVPKDALAGVDYDVDELTRVWRITNSQDATLVERTQKGVLSPAYRPGPYAPDEEEGVMQFVDWYCERMLAHRDSSATPTTLTSRRAAVSV